ncbi:MAG TPA: hypothetical protein VI451_11035, partial [Anaerolineales bacterium]|nr:hypothetical protein [Anaerolineales bacterium]
MKYKIAIDFGTTNSAIACWLDETARGKTIEIPGLSHPTSSGDYLIPTLLCVKDGRIGETLIGHVIRTQGEDIHHVLLVGGTAFIPSVQQTLDGYFRAITERHKKIFDMPEWPSLTWSVDNTTIRVDKPFTAVVEEALQVSAGFGLDD